MRREKVVVYIDDMRLVGFVHLVRAGSRVSDHLNQTTTRFIPLTEVTFYNKEGQRIKEEKFVCLNKDLITIVEEKGEADE